MQPKITKRDRKQLLKWQRKSDENSMRIITNSRLHNEIVTLLSSKGASTQVENKKTESATLRLLEFSDVVPVQYQVNFL